MKTVENKFKIDVSLIAYEKQNRPNKISRILMSILILFMLSAYIYLYIQSEQTLIVLIFWLIYGIAGLYSIYTGKPYLNIIGDAYLRIGDTEIRYKPGVLKKEEKYSWDDITKVVSKPGYLLFELKQGKNFKLPYSNLEYIKVQKVKTVLQEMLKDKGVIYE
jgi:hypothetical protein